MAFDRKAYRKIYIEKNKKRINEKNREHMKKKRAELQVKTPEDLNYKIKYVTAIKKEKICIGKNYAEYLDDLKT